MAKPRERHWKATKRVLGYLNDTDNFDLKYTDEFDVELTGHSNLD